MKPVYKISAILFLMTTFLAGCGEQTPKTPRDPVVVQLKWVHQAQFAGCYVADKKGLYAKENMDVTLIPGGPGVTPAKKIAALVAGKSHFAIIDGDDLLKFKTQGQPLVAIAVIFQKNPYVYVTLKRSGITGPLNFAGKKIMVPDEGRTQHDALLQKLGITGAGMKYIPYKRDVAPLADGQVDVHMMYRTGLALSLEEKGIDMDFIWLDDYGMRFYADTIVTTEQIIQQNPKLVERFLRATLDGWRFAIENQAEAVDITLQYDAALTKNHQARMLRSEIPLIHTGEFPIGWMEKNVWETMQETLITAASFDNKANIDKAYTMAFLNRIYGNMKN